MTLDLGIVAHVDAGKTSLTERLLYDAGVITSIGGVDTGDTQTDTDDLERSRGITIRSAVVAFSLGDLQVNLIDTPGHSDFIAEVERSLGVLDAAVLVISAVEGVQAQTRVLMRTLRRLRIPTVIFVNKVDRMGARTGTLVDEIRSALSDRVLPMSGVRGLGTRDACVRPLPLNRPEVLDLLTEDDDQLLAEYVRRGRIDVGPAIARQTAQARLHPLYFGSAITGAGVVELAAGLRGFLPTGSTDDGRLRGQVFKIERSESGEKISYVRLRSGRLTARQHVILTTPDGGSEVRVTAVQPFRHGTATEPGVAVAGDIAKVWGLRRASIGDQLGVAAERVDARMVSPGLESVVTPDRPEQRIALHTALELLAEEDPLINTHLAGDEIAVSLYGEVQAEVLRARLQRDFGVSAEFAPARTVCVEKPVGAGEAVERISPGGLFDATVGLRVEPAPVGSGIQYDDATAPGHMPVSFHHAIEEVVRRSLQQGVYGWGVTDCRVTLIERGYSPPSSTAGDFRNLTPLVLAAALMQARTRVYEPLNAFEIDAPVGAVRPIMRLLGDAGASLSSTDVRADRVEVTGELPAGQVYRVSNRLPGVTSGDGAFVSRPSGYRRITGRQPVRPRTDGNPYNRKEYLMFLANV